MDDDEQNVDHDHDHDMGDDLVNDGVDDDE